MALGVALVAGNAGQYSSTIELMIINLFGSTERKNQRWDARYASPVVTMFGGTELDFRFAELGEGQTEVAIITGAGGVKVIVPEDLPVLVSGVSVFGGRDVLGQSSGGIVHGTDHATPDYSSASGRRLRLTIFTAFGGVEVQRLPVAVPMAV